MNTQPIQVRRRQVAEAVTQGHEASGFSPLVARLLAGRGIEPGAINPQLSVLDSPFGLPDIHVAADRIASAVIEGESIGLETDYDVDGSTAHAVMRSALVDYFGHPADKLIPYVGHRLKDGYGLSQNLATRIVEEGAVSLVVTADNGSSDEPRIAQLAAAGIDVIVTDHHAIPESGIPQSAVAVVSPARSDSQYPDRTIAGVMVAWLLMCVVRAKLVEAEHLQPTAAKLSGLLDWVACGTVADCVNLGHSRNNRAVVRYGLHLIDSGARACWRAIRPYLGDPDAPLRSDAIAFGIGPRINARTRLNEPMVAIDFLMAETDEQAFELAGVLDAENTQRKAIEAQMVEQAVALAAGQVEMGRRGLCLLIPGGHVGVNGIVASRVKERFGLPTVVLSANVDDDALATGSARSVDGLDIRAALVRVHGRLPNAVKKLGGHKAAAGLTIVRSAVDQVAAAFAEAVEQQADVAEFGIQRLTDGMLEAADCSLRVIDEIEQVGPFGQGFPAPLFEVSARVVNLRLIGRENPDHLKMTLSLGKGGPVEAILFHRSKKPGAEALVTGSSVRFLVRLTDNFFRGRRSVQLIVEDVLPASEFAQAS